jgi:hypothetical protein
MADEVFALSPISARGALLSEQDYDAIREAFMETSRGRWFLGEYAKRNRNADTTMVLDAVVRIEQAVAAQKQEPARHDDLLEALAAIRSTVEQAETAASGALAGLKLTEKLAPIHKGARIIREISWRWREIGADGRICDLIDSQLVAIEASCTEIAETDDSKALGAAFDLLKHKLDELAEGEAPSAEVSAKTNAKANVTTFPGSVAARAPEPAAAREAKTAASDKAPARTTLAKPGPSAAKPLPQTAIVKPEPEPVKAAAAAAKIEPEAVDAQAIEAQDLEQDLRQVLEQELAQAHAQDLARDVAPLDELAQSKLAEDEFAKDEAVLEMVAMEMAAPDDSVDDFFQEAVAEVQTTLPTVSPVTPKAPEPTPPPRLEVAPPSRPRLEIAPDPTPPRTRAEPAPPTASEPSLGSTLIANGILPRPKPPSDPLAPLRRMSQAEKIAFFS